MRAPWRASSARSLSRRMRAARRVQPVAGQRGPAPRTPHGRLPAHARRDRALEFPSTTDRRPLAAGDGITLHESRPHGRTFSLRVARSVPAEGPRGSDGSDDRPDEEDRQRPRRVDVAGAQRDAQQIGQRGGRQQPSHDAPAAPGRSRPVRAPRRRAGPPRTGRWRRPGRPRLGACRPAAGPAPRRSRAPRTVAMTSRPATSRTRVASPARRPRRPAEPTTWIADDDPDRDDLGRDQPVPPERRPAEPLEDAVGALVRRGDAQVDQAGGHDGQGETARQQRVDRRIRRAGSARSSSRRRRARRPG